MSGNTSTYELFTKPESGDLSTAANASMLEITTDKSVVRSVVFEASNAALGGNPVVGS